MSMRCLSDRWARSCSCCPHPPAAARTLHVNNEGLHEATPQRFSRRGRSCANTARYCVLYTIYYNSWPSGLSSDGSRRGLGTLFEQHVVSGAEFNASACGKTCKEGRGTGVRAPPMERDPAGASWRAALPMQYPHPPTQESTRPNASKHQRRKTTTTQSSDSSTSRISKRYVPSPIPPATHAFSAFFRVSLRRCRWGTFCAPRAAARNSSAPRSRPAGGHALCSTSESLLQIPCCPTHRCTRRRRPPGHYVLRPPVPRSR